MLGVDASEVCMSLLGVPSLWTIPGEKDVYGNVVKICKKNTGTVPEKPTPAAFSEQSIASMLREGLIDIEAKAMLRRVGGNADSVLVYDRSQPTLMIRDPEMSMYKQRTDVAYSNTFNRSNL